MSKKGYFLKENPFSWYFAKPVIPKSQIFFIAHYLSLVCLFSRFSEWDQIFLFCAFVFWLSASFFKVTTLSHSYIFFCRGVWLTHHLLINNHSSLFIMACAPQTRVLSDLYSSRVYLFNYFRNCYKLESPDEKHF